MESDNSSINEKRSMNGHADHPLEKPHVDTTNVDVAAELTAGRDFVLDPAEAARVRYVVCIRCSRLCAGGARRGLRQGTGCIA